MAILCHWTVIQEEKSSEMEELDVIDIRFLLHLTESYFHMLFCAAIVLMDAHEHTQRVQGKEGWVVSEEKQCVYICVRNKRERDSERA